MTRVILPDEPPTLTPRGWRELLEIVLAAHGKLERPSHLGPACDTRYLWACLHPLYRRDLDGYAPCAEPAEQHVNPDNGEPMVPLCDRHRKLMAAVVRWEDEKRCRDERRERIERTETFGVVYFLQRGDGLVKIGYSTQFQSRLRSLTKEHGPLTVLGIRRGGIKTEADLHRRFKKANVSGEWHRPVPSLLRYADGCRAEVTLKSGTPQVDA